MCCVFYNKVDKFSKIKSFYTLINCSYDRLKLNNFCKKYLKYRKRKIISTNLYNIIYIFYEK